MKKRMLRLLALLMLLCAATVPVRAAAVLELSRTDCSISVTMRDGKTVVSGGSMTCYRVGGIHSADNGDLSFVLTGEFSGAGVSLAKPDDPVTAQRLAFYAARNSIAGTTRTIGNDGTVTFTGLTPGLYLLVQREAAPGYYAAAPFLVTLPMRENGGYVYAVDASPKVDVERPGISLPTEPDTPTPPDQPDGPDQPTPPDQPTDPTNPGKPSDPNKPTNPSNPNKPSNPSKPDVPKLPQTGQLNWPVPVLAAGGLCLLLLGRVLWGGKRGRHED